MPPGTPDSGVYHYRLNGEPVGVEERWQRHPQGSGACRISSSRSAPGVEIVVDALVAGAQVTQFEVVWRSDGQNELRSSYQLLADRVVVNRTVAGEQGQSEEVVFPAEGVAPLLFPLMRIFTGPLIASLLEQGGRGVVVLPFIGNPALTSRLLLPVSSERQARVLETDAELELAGASVRCRRCEYLGDQYGPGTEFWLAEDKLLLRYQWRQSPQQHWDIWLQRDCGSE
ncbi:MAG: hypothetical protein H6985_18620 [Pseudomonadales bacterium]|nr:hypothetical protein [Halioglobus sp.]MCP5131583.1 hypothetical protein [Pseudomonadales bacterium]